MLPLPRRSLNCGSRPPSSSHCRLSCDSATTGIPRSFPIAFSVPLIRPTRSSTPIRQHPSNCMSCKKSTTSTSSSPFIRRVTAHARSASRSRLTHTRSGHPLTAAAAPSSRSRSLLLVVPNSAFGKLTRASSATNRLNNCPGCISSELNPTFSPDSHQNRTRFTISAVFPVLGRAATTCSPGCSPLYIAVRSGHAAGTPGQ